MKNTFLFTWEGLILFAEITLKGGGNKIKSRKSWKPLTILKSNFLILSPYNLIIWS